MSKLSSIYKTLKSAGFSDEEISQFSIAYTGLTLQAILGDPKRKSNPMLNELYPDAIKYTDVSGEEYMIKPGDSLWHETE
jgi:hypothetical protein